MKALVTTILAGFLLAPAAFAANPNPGTYQSTDLGGSLLTGRAATSRTGVNTGPNYILNTESWNGLALATQWWMRCASSPGYTVNNQLDGNGTGVIIYSSTFTGGRFHFEPGPWAAAAVEGNLTSVTTNTTVQYVNFAPVASVVNGHATGMFDGGCALTFVIANGVGVCETPYCPVKPADYPAFLDPNCDPTRMYGTWGNVITITMNIDCATPARPTTWGQLKTIYR